MRELTIAKFSLFSMLITLHCGHNTEVVAVEDRGHAGEKADSFFDGSCAEACGGQSQDGHCYCDGLCHEYGDCCHDKIEICDVPDECGVGEQNPCDPCGSDGSCNPECHLIDDPDPDCPHCEGDGVCDPSCDTSQSPDPDCPVCVDDGSCNSECAEGLDPDCVEDLTCEIVANSSMFTSSVPARMHVISLDWTGENFGFTWRGSQTGDDRYIRISTADAHGDNLGPNSDMATFASVFDLSGFSTVWTGERYGVAWGEKIASGSMRVFFRGLDDQGAPLSEPIALTETSSTTPSLAWNGSEYGVAWNDRRTGSRYDVYFMRFDASGNPLGEETRIDDGPAHSMNPRLIWTGSEFGLAWEEHNEDSEIHFVRIDSTSNILGDATVLGSASGGSYSTRLAWTGSEYGVAWGDGREGSFEVYFARLDSTGALVGEETKVTDAVVEAMPTALVWTGSEFGLAYVDEVESGSNFRAAFMRLDATGLAVGDALLLSDGSTDCRGPKVVWTGSEYAVLFSSYASDNSELWFNTIQCGE